MRFLRYSLATLLLGVTILCFTLGPWVNRVHVQEQLIADIERLGGSVDFAPPDIENGDRPNMAWLHSLLGEKYFRTIQAVTLERQSIPPDLLARITRVDGLFSLSLREDQLADDDLRAIGQLQQLRVLRIGFNPITNAGLAHLHQLHELLLLDLCVTRMDDLGLKELKNLAKLRRVELYGDEITDLGADILAQMPNLCELDLANTKITSAGLAPLVALPRLSDLRLDQMRLGSGEELRISDTAIKHLRAMPKLRNLSVLNLPISAAALQELKQARPAITIGK